MNKKTKKVVEVEDIKPSAVESLTGEKPKPKENVIPDPDEPIEEILDLEDEDDELKKEALDKLFDRDNLSMITDINRPTAVTMAKAHLISRTRNCGLLADYADSIKEHLISNKRQGRGEAVKVIHVPSESFGEPIDEKPIKDKIWGK